MDKQTENTNQTVMIDLTDTSSLNMVKEELNDIIIQDDAQAAHNFVKNLGNLLNQNKNLEKDKPDFFVQYQEILNTAKWICLSWLSENEVADIFEENIVPTLRTGDIIIWDKIRVFLISNFLIEDRDVVKRRLREALIRNNEILTIQSLNLEGNKVEGTVGNWLKEYNNKLGAMPLGQRSIEVYKYISQDKNVQKLSEDEKNLLTKLFDIYERLKLSSLDLLGYEGTLGIADEEEGKFGVLSDGVVSMDSEKVREKLRLAEIIRDVALGKRPTSDLDELITKQKLSQGTALFNEKEEEAESTVSPKEIAVEPSFNQQEILAAYQGDARKQQAINKEEEKLAKKVGDDTAKLRAEFFSAMQKKNINLSIGALRLLAKKNDLDLFLQQDAKLNKFLAAIWEKQYGKDLAEEFSKNPMDVKFIRLFLQYVLQDRLGLNTSDAARIGLQIGNIFVNLGKKSYNKMAYFDVGKKEFMWFE